MAAYIHGNLAVEERRPAAPAGRVKIKETRKVVYRTSRLPVQEKLLYLFTVFVCVVVAGTIIWRYSQIYQMNTRIHDVELQIRHLEAENSSLKEKLSKLQEPEQLMKEAQTKGLSSTPDGKTIRVPSKDAKAPAKSSKENVALKP